MSRKYILDTNAVGDFINHRHGVTYRATTLSRKGYRIGTCPPVIGELFAGAFISATQQRNLPIVTRGLRQLVVWPYDEKAAEVYGRITALLKSVGRPMQVVDIQLAAIALVMGCTVVTTDSDLSAIPGLSVEDWTKPITL
jgi:tRNA(fMet)-specific endonuclease VapC